MADETEDRGTPQLDHTTHCQQRKFISQMKFAGRYQITLKDVPLKRVVSLVKGQAARCSRELMEELEVAP